MRTAKTQSAKSNQGIHFPLTESLDTIEGMNGEQRPVYYFAYAQDDLDLRILRMFEGTFRLTRSSYIIHSLNILCRHLYDAFLTQPSL